MVDVWVVVVDVCDRPVASQEVLDLGSRNKQEK